MRGRDIEWKEDRRGEERRRRAGEGWRIGGDTNCIEVFDRFDDFSIFIGNQ